MALPSSGFSLQDVVDEITKYGNVSLPPENVSLAVCFSAASQSGFALPGRDSLADFGGYEQPPPVPESIVLSPDTITNISYTGQTGIQMTVDVEDAYSTTWAVTVINYAGFDPVNISNISPSAATGDGSFSFNVGANNDYVLKRSFIRVYKSNQDPNNPSIYDETLIEQQAAPNLFTYDDAGVGGFAVNRNTGLVTAPSASFGTITNLSYSSGYSGGYYPLVTTDTLRSVNVTVQVPAGYDNSGQTVSGTESTYQQFLPETIDIASSTGGGIDPQGEAFVIDVFTAEPTYSTSWTASLTYANPSNSSGWVQFS